MNLELPDIAVELGASAARAFTDAGGVDLARRAEADPSLRTSVVAPLLDRIGVSDLDPTADLDVAFAGAQLCRSAGRVALPYPVVSVLAGAGGTPVALVDQRVPRTDHADLFPTWRLASLTGTVGSGVPRPGPLLATKLGPFVGDLVLTSANEVRTDAPLAVILGAWRILGTLERAVEITSGHVNDRQQFGRPLAGFQAVQFQLADATVAVHGLTELAAYTLWRWSAAPADRVVDALALRVSALESANQVLRTCHQLHGAVGFCDEHDLSVLTRHVQPLLRLPAGLEATTEQLIDAVSTHGFVSLFGTSTEGSATAPAVTAG